MIEIGSLVRFKQDGDFGIVTGFRKDHRDRTHYLIKWSDGSQIQHLNNGTWEVIA